MTATSDVRLTDIFMPAPLPPACRLDRVRCRSLTDDPHIPTHHTRFRRPRQPTAESFVQFDAVTTSRDRLFRGLNATTCDPRLERVVTIRVLSNRLPVTVNWPGADRPDLAAGGRDTGAATACKGQARCLVRPGDVRPLAD